MYALARHLGSGPLRGRRATFCSARGVMYALARHLGSGPLCFSFAWQARDFLLCKGRDVRSGAAPGLRASVLQFRVAGARLSALQGA